MRTRVNNPIHIEIKVIDNLISRQSLIETTVDVGVLVGEPTEHLWDTEQGCGCCFGTVGEGDVGDFVCMFFSSGLEGCGVEGCCEGCECLGLMGD